MVYKEHNTYPNRTQIREQRVFEHARNVERKVFQCVGQDELTFG